MPKKPAVPKCSKNATVQSQKRDSTKTGNGMTDQNKPARPLTSKQKRFIAEYQKDLNGTQSAIRAGYSKKTAKEQAARLLSNANIRETVETKNQSICEKLGIDSEYILSGIKELAETTKKLNPKWYNPSASAKAHELLGKHLKLFTDKIENSGNIQIVVTSNTGRAPRGSTD